MFDEVQLSYILKTSELFKVLFTLVNAAKYSTSPRKKKLVLCHSSDVTSAKEIWNIPLRLFSPFLCLGSHIYPWERANKTETVCKIKKIRLKVCSLLKIFKKNKDGIDRLL